MQPKMRTLWVLAGILVLGFFLYTLRAVLTPVFMALVLAYLLDPVIDRLEGWRIPRTSGILLFVTGVIVAFAAVVLVLIPLVQKEMSAAISSFPEYFRKTQETVFPWIEKTLGRRLPHTVDEVVAEISANIQNIPPDIIKPFASVLSRVFSNTLYIILGLLNLVVIPVFTFYFLRDFDLMKKRAAEFIPLAYYDWTVDKLKQVDETLGAFLRGQLTVCTVLAVLYSAGLVLTGIDMAVVIGISSGYLFIVPYLGTIFGIIMASIMALLKFHDLFHLAAVWAVFGVVQLFESYFLTPRIVGERVGLSPVLVIISLLIGGGLFGFLGILIAVPAAAVLKIFANDLLEYYHRSELYLGGDKKAGEGETKNEAT